MYRVHFIWEGFELTTSKLDKSFSPIYIISVCDQFSIAGLTSWLHFRSLLINIITTVVKFQDEIPANFPNGGI